jgi:ribosomal protein S27AE
MTYAYFEVQAKGYVPGSNFKTALKTCPKCGR